MTLPDRPIPHLFAALGLALVAVLLRHHAFVQTSFATGWDSYFYLVQLQSLEETGRMHSPEGSLIYPFFQAFYRVTHDYLAALKWGTAVLCGTWAFLCCLLPRDRKTGLLLGAWAVFSPHLTYFAAQYPKNLLGLVLFLALLVALEHGGKNKLILVGILLVLNYFGHRMTFGLSAVYLLLYLFFRWEKPWMRGWLTGRNLLIAGLCALVLVVAGSTLPGLARLVDFHRLEGTFSVVPQFAPWSFISGFGLERISGWWLGEIAVAVMALAVTLVGMLRRLGQWDAALAGLCLLLLFPFLKWDFSGLSWRFFLVFVLVAPLLIRGTAFRPVVAWLAPVLLLASFFSWKNYDPKSQDPNYQLFARVTEAAAKHFAGNKPELVVAHNALAEYFTFTTHIDAMPWLPEYQIDAAQLWRIAAGVRLETLRFYAGETARTQVIALGGGYVLLPEHTWQTACAQARAAEDTGFLETANGWRNPGTVRPGWLLERKSKQ